MKQVIEIEYDKLAEKIIKPGGPELFPCWTIPIRGRNYTGEHRYDLATLDGQYSYIGTRIYFDIDMSK